MRACLIFSASAVSALGGFHNANVGPLGRMQAPAGRRGRGHVGDSDPSRMPAVVASSERRVLPRRRPSRRSCSPDDRHHATDRETPVVVVIINGTAPGLIVTNIYRVPSGGFRDDDAKNDDGRVATDAMVSLSDLFTAEDMTRLRLSSHDVTLPAALMLLDPTKYPTQSRARKAIRQRSICICRHRGGDVCAAEKNETLEFDELGKVIARVHPGDVIGFQRRAGSDYYAVEGVPYRPPPFEVPVIFEDDHMAIVNKPAGIVVYRAEGGRGGGARAGGHGRDTLLSALSFVLMPSNFTSGGGENDGDDDDGERNRPLKRPHPVHRLDRPTSGLMVIAKTKGAAVHLAQQFEYRKARKTYCAIVNGAPIMSPYHEDGGSYSEWNTIDHDLDEKSAITEWRRIKKIRSLRGKDGQLSLLELKPRTGEKKIIGVEFYSPCFFSM
jgi:23S rRNA-/tRNA-specific pseudouridylate synthase